MQRWSTRLRDDLKIIAPDSNQMATTIAQEVSALSDDAKQRIRNASQIPPLNRIDELIGFEGFMELVDQVPPHPAISRAQVVYQNYISFVYLEVSCFNVLNT